MNIEVTEDASGVYFHLNKWYLDFVGDNGEAMIFYAAKIKWHGWTVSFTSWLQYDPAYGVNLKTRFRNVQTPQINDDLITWSDSKFNVSGKWKSLTKMIQARIFDTREGFVDWKCFQPASKVELKINDKILEGKGYAELLIMTVPPWKIPMDELQWGRFGSVAHNIVWIELRAKDKRQWVWLNGVKIENCIIEDDHISIPEIQMVLNLDRGIVLESEKKIFSVVQKIIRYMPGVNKIIPVNFLMADETKWLSNGQLLMQNNTYNSGMAIHEFVNFKA